MRLLPLFGKEGTGEISKMLSKSSLSKILCWTDVVSTDNVALQKVAINKHKLHLITSCLPAGRQAQAGIQQTTLSPGLPNLMGGLWGRYSTRWPPRWSIHVPNFTKESLSNSGQSGGRQSK
jgi:hypothetical protein